MTDKKHLKLKRFIAIISVVIFLGLMVYLTYFIGSALKTKINSPADFKALIDSYGWKGYLVAFGVQMLQVFVALIPGEAVEIGAGYAFGWLGGAIICMAGVTVASAAVFALTKLAGRRLVELFVDPDKIDNLRFLNSEKKLVGTIFLLFFLPGTPKDLLTYFVGLTRISLTQFLAVSLVARIPSVLSSVLVGHFAVEENYFVSAVIFIATALLSLVGLLVYKKFVRGKSQKLKAKIKSHRSK